MTKQIIKHAAELDKLSSKKTTEEKALIYVKENLGAAKLIGSEIFGDEMTDIQVFEIYDKIESALSMFGNKYGAHTQDGPKGGAGGKPKPIKTGPRATGGIRG